MATVEPLDRDSHRPGDASPDRLQRLALTCTWCGRPLGTILTSAHETGAVSQGICATCADILRRSTGTSR